MALNELLIRDFRNLSRVQLDKLVTRGFNFFYGLNGSGKTSLLEAIYYLAHKRSFRSLNAKRLIRHDAERFSVFSKIISQNEQHIPLGVERLTSGESTVRLDSKEVDSLSELANVLPTRLINVHSHLMLEGSPLFRRKYLDWGIFYLNDDFLPIWYRFKRFLRQRNAALRHQASPQELASWTREVVAAGLAFHALRQAYFDQLLPIIREILSGFFDIRQLKISYKAGWDESASYEEILASSLAQDLERGHTHYGPHRADLSVSINRVSAKDVLSTGQQKLLVCGMILAQGALLARLTQRRPIYLIDDLPAELDIDSRRWLISTLAEQQAQIFVTAVEQEAMSGILAQMDEPVKMFHVKQGMVEEIS